MDQNALALNVIMYDRVQGKLVADYGHPDSHPHLYRLLPTDEFGCWAKENVTGKIRFMMVEIDPTLVRNGGVELRLRQRRFENYAQTQGRTDLPTPQTVKRLQVSFENELDALHFKMRWCG